MSDQVVLAIIASIPATIAAVSSLINGREQRRVRRELAEVNGKILSRRRHRAPKGNGPGQHGFVDHPDVASSPDWYKPPDL